MKNYREMAHSVFVRRDQYEINKKSRRNILIRTVTPICCFCLVMLLGIGLWQGGMFNTTPHRTAGDSVIEGEKDWYGPGESEPSGNGQDDNRKVAMTLTYEGKKYNEVTNLSYLGYYSYDEVVLDKYVGKGNDFEGTYTDVYLGKRYGTTVDGETPGDTVQIKITTEVFTVKDRPDLICVKLSNGELDILKTYD